MKRVVLFGVGLSMALMFSSGNAPSAQAQAQMGYYGGWGGWGINFPFGLYGRRVEDVPYFAMFPPVYYSMPVPRAYGWSPFAYPPGILTPEVETVVPQEIINPYVPPSEEPTEAKPSSAQVKTASYQAPVPQVVINPYVKTANIASRAGASR